MNELVGKVVSTKAWCKGCNTNTPKGTLCIRVPATKGYGVLCNKCVLECAKQIKELENE